MRHITLLLEPDFLHLFYYMGHKSGFVHKQQLLPIHIIPEGDGFFQKFFFLGHGKSSHHAVLLQLRLAEMHVLQAS